MHIEVIPGEIEVNAVALIREAPGLRIYMLDMKSKRASVGGYGSSEDSDDTHTLEVLFERDEETLCPTPPGEPTFVKFVGISEDWNIRATAGRYLCHIFLWQGDPEQFEEVWVSND